ncbi:MAG: bifunctional 2',3'-cyclic-nucleotide 2'-phosphodiesterase/3'-nucleotidase [Pseudomonadota bacterium]
MSKSNDASATQFQSTHTPNGSDLLIRVLNTSDLHMEIYPYDYYADQKRRGHGLARAATLIENRRAGAPNTLLFDNGDFLQGNPMGDWSVEQHKAGSDAIHPMIDAMNLMRFDAATLGNHEFNYGLNFLQDTLAAATFPWVCANAVRERGATPADDKRLLPPYALLERQMIDAGGDHHMLRIGVLGLLPPQITYWDKKHLSGRVETRGIFETARFYAPKMKSEGADIVIALCHSGVSEKDTVGASENAALSVAALPDIDVVLAGHSHLVFPSSAFEGIIGVDVIRGHLHGKPATMAGFGGSHIGQIDLVLKQQSSGWQVLDSHVAVMPVDDLEDAPSALENEILEKTHAAHTGTRAYTRKPAGRTKIALDSYFAMIEPSSAVLFVATAQAWYAETHMSDIKADIPLLSAAAPFKMGGRAGPNHFVDVPAGDVAVRHVSDLYGYPNMLCIVEVNGEELQNWLEYSAGLFNKITLNLGPQPLRNSAFPSYNFDTITGVTYKLDVSNDARFTVDGGVANPGSARVRDLRIHGDRVSSDMTFRIVTNDFRVNGSGTFPGADDCRVVCETQVLLKDVLLAFLRETAPDRELLGAPWALTKVDGASALLETSPKATHKKSRLHRLNIEPLNITNNGFQRLKFDF